MFVMPCYAICDCLYKCMLLHIFIQSVSRLKPYDKILISIAESFVVVAFACLSVTRVELCPPSLAAISPGLDRGGAEVAPIHWPHFLRAVWPLSRYLGLRGGILIGGCGP